MDMAALADISFQYMHECIQVASLGFDVLCVTSHNITANDGKSSQLFERVERRQSQDPDPLQKTQQCVYKGFICSSKYEFVLIIHSFHCLSFISYIKCCFSTTLYHSERGGGVERI